MRVERVIGLTSKQMNGINMGVYKKDEIMEIIFASKKTLLSQFSSVFLKTIHTIE